jgi:hypothetical protein
MNKKNLFLVGLVLLLAGLYAVYFTDWFQTRTILISATANRSASTRLGAGRAGAGRVAARLSVSTSPIAFALNDYYELTDIKVYSLTELETNKLALPLWHLVGDPSSDSINSFVYGQNLEGMAPPVNGLQPEPLQPGVMYRIFLTDGKIKGQHDFHLGAAPANASTNKQPASVRRP